jgi:hypothetical protein
MSSSTFKLLFPTLLLAVVTGCSSGHSPVVASSASHGRAIVVADEEPSQAEAWKQVEQALGKAGELKDGVYTVSFPRDDLNVRIEGMDVPTGAGLESTFHFYQCSCGKTVVIGQFVCADYEANDIAYALQKENLLVSTMGPYLLYEKPRLMVVRFQAEGKPQPLAAAIKSAINWTGRNRIPPPQKLTP